MIRPIHTFFRSYQALFDLCKMLLSNPFGKRRIDVAHDSIGQGVAAFARGLAAGTPYVPASMTPGVMAAWRNSESPEFIASPLPGQSWESNKHVQDIVTEKFGFDN